MAHKFVGGFSRLTGILGQTGKQRPKIDYHKKTHQSLKNYNTMTFRSDRLEKR